MKTLSLLTAAAALLTLPGTASAGTILSGSAALTEWNLVVFNDLNSSSEVEGRTFVGGDLSGQSSNYQIRTPAASANGWDGLTVVGNVTGGTKNLNNGSGAMVGGNVASGFNLNGPVQTVRVGGTIANTNVNQNTVLSNQSSVAGFTDLLTTQRSVLVNSLTALSNGLAAAAKNSDVTILNNRATFNATPGAGGIAVFNLTAAAFATFGEIQFNLNGADTAIVNVTGSSVMLNDNFLGNVDNLGRDVIWNFTDATTLNLSTAWRGSVLATRAAGTTSNYIQGSAVFNSLNQNGEIHLDTFSSAVPEPASWALFILGFGTIGGALRRRARGGAVAA